MPVIPEFSGIKQEDCKFDPSLGYTVKPYIREREGWRRGGRESHSNEGSTVKSADGSSLTHPLGYPNTSNIAGPFLQQWVRTGAVPAALFFGVFCGLE